MASAVEIPRAMSWSSSHPLYSSEAIDLAPLFDVLLGGEIVPRVVTYDCDAGYVTTYKRHERGGLVLEEGTYLPIPVVATGKVTLLRREARR